jgi:hypothetical protein
MSVDLPLYACSNSGSDGRFDMMEKVDCEKEKLWVDLSSKMDARVLAERKGERERKVVLIDETAWTYLCAPHQARKLWCKQMSYIGQVQGLRTPQPSPMQLVSRPRRVEAYVWRVTGCELQAETYTGFNFIWPRSGGFGGLRVEPLPVTEDLPVAGERLVDLVPASV